MSTDHNDSSTSSAHLGGAGITNQAGRPVVDQDFSLFKDNLQNQLEVVLPFGFSSAPHVFIRLLKPLEKHWRLQGICIAFFWMTVGAQSKVDKSGTLLPKLLETTWLVQGF